ncbi:probable G-protein coupled receptor No18 [Macrobrachium nipponense]|uniref:probable G-protein coupled receptor No18 n=1 Tax=Macrobrachium nipponense TaxID=159736 RepID=UPI0030C7C161
MTGDISSPDADTASAIAGAASSASVVSASSSSASSTPAESEPSVNQKLFLVVSVALATVCFFTNVVQVAVFARPSAVRSVKSILLLSQALSGLVAAFVVAFPIHVISARGGSVVGDEGYAACYLGHSTVILLTALTSLGTSTLLLLHHYMKLNHPRRFMTAGSNTIGWSMAVGAVWLVAIVVSILPYAGWNSWEDHDSHCHLSTLWPLSFTAFLTFLVGGHVAAALLMWASTRATQLKAMSTRRGNAPPSACPDQEEAPIANHVLAANNRSSGNVCVGGWCVSVASLLPILAHVVVASSCAASARCQANPQHYHEEAASLPWLSLLLAAAAVTNPLLYVFTDDQVSSSTLLLLSQVCCWWCERRKQRLIPRQQEPHDAETNVYVTNDTDHLVSDNT